MLSHIIYKNKKNINTEKFYAIPIGPTCSSAIACKIANIRKFSLPFDWTIPSFPLKIKNVLENDFEDYIPDVKNNIYINKYDFELAHFNKDLEKGIEEYERRIDRFKNIIIDNEKNFYFIYINENYLYDELYRQKEFNDNILNELLELDNFIKNKYSYLNYNILYFNFIEDKIPENSNIINIVINSSIYYDDVFKSPYEDFRIYCGKILQELFMTELDIEISYHNLFNN